MQKKIVVAACLAGVLAVLFPPWGLFGKYETHAFLLSKHVPSSAAPDWPASIMWPVLGLELLAILFAGVAAYFFAKE